MNFQEIAAELSMIASTGSTLSKERMLKLYGEKTPGFKEVIKFIYDPYFTTGIGIKKLDKVSYYGFSPDRRSVEEVMAYLSKHSSGSDYDTIVAYSFIFSDEDPDWQWAATGLVTKDLQIGVSVTTLNKVFGKGFIPLIGIMRGMQCPTSAKGIYIATEKIDGNRRLIMNKETGVEIYTRSGKRDTGLVEIEEQARLLPLNYVYDTECVAVGDFVDSIELRQASASILNSRGKRTGVKALCFDILPQHEYDAGKSTIGAVGRKTMLAAMFNDRLSVDMLYNYFIAHDIQHGTHYANSVNAVEAGFRKKGSNLDNISCLPILGIAHNRDEGIELAKPIWETGGEGVMLVEYRSPYEVNPNPRNTLLKIKATQEFVLMCTGVCMGENKYAGTLGAIEVAYKRPGDNKIYTVKVGSGFPDYLRNMYWDRPEMIVGKYVEIESFGESRNAQGAYSLNCPIFKRVAGEKE